ncbi:MAG: tandem-95 repeat protein [Acidimicrobiia bacterium]|nr:tandem-95 repeat protein [Acidimicrobiia bacterium]
MGTARIRHTLAYRILIMLAAFAVVLPVFAQTPHVQAAETDLWTAAGPGVVVNETGDPGEDIYIVLHQAPPLALYAGEVPGLAATSPEVTGAARLDANSAASLAYRSYLATQHDVLVAAIESSIGREVEVRFHYDAVLNGIAVTLTPDEAQIVSSLQGVDRVERDSVRYLQTDNGPVWIGADAIWGEEPVTGAEACEGTCGEGVVVGVIDTGVNYDHPSFAAVGGDGYVHTNPRGQFYGACDPVTGLPFCNDKLIGYHDFTGTGPEDDNGHGSHTASTSAGNVLSIELMAPTITVPREISGVAPHANVISYKGCSGTPIGCVISALLAAINTATLDGVDVINYSIGGSSANPWSDLDAQAFFGAYSAGIFVATSASNDGPGFGTLGSPADAPWVTSVGASTHDRALRNGVVDMVNADGVTPGPADIFGASLTAPLASHPVVYAGDYGHPLCGAGTGDPATGEGSGGNPFVNDGIDLTGLIVVCDRGEYGRVHKSENVAEAGAAGYVLANDSDSGDSLVGDAYPIPGVHISYDNGIILKNWIAANGGAGTARINGSNPTISADNGDIMASFSSRGANPAAPSLVKPDVTAPGVDVLAAWMSPVGEATLQLPFGDAVVVSDGQDEYGIISGTSMSSPHTAGAGALIRAAHPDWSPDEVKSALMTTAFSDIPTDGETHPVLKEDRTTLADPFDMGAGRIDLRQAANAGMIFGETAANYTAADPSTGGDPRTLNIPSLGDDSCDDTCSWTRTVTSSADEAVTWTASVAADSGVTLTVSPASFVLAPGVDNTFSVTADVSAADSGWHFGKVTLTPSDASIPVVNLPVAVLPVGDGGGGGVVPTALHMHGNTHDEGCTGDGRADLIACDGPFLSDDPDLDTAPAAKFGPVSPALDGTNSRNIYDPNWIWHVAEPATIEGSMTVSMWASCGGCAEGVFSANWDVRVFDTDAAGATPVFDQTVVDATPIAPNVPSLVEFTVQLPEFVVASSLVLQIDPVFIDSQQNTIIYYDSQQPCGDDPTGPCDSVVYMPITSGGGVNRPPVATDDSADVESGGTVTIDVLANDSDPNGDPITLDSYTEPANGTLVDNGGGSFEYTHNGGDSLSDTFTYTISDDKGLDATGTVTITVVGSALTLRNSFVSAVGWVKPGEGYPFRVIVENPTSDDATNVAVTVEVPDGTTFVTTTESAGSASISGDINWTIPSLGAGETATMVVQAQADSQAQDLQIVWKNLSSTATMSYDDGPVGIMSMSHGPKVIPTDATYDTARYGDRPFPVVPVDWFDRKHEAEHTADLLAAKINSPDVPGSTFNLFQEMSLGQLFPNGTVPSIGIASAEFDGQDRFSDPQPSGACTGTTFKAAAGSPVYSERIVNGWYQMPGDTNYYGADKFTFGGSIGGAVTGVGPLLQIDDACGPTGKAVYDAAHIADPEIDYNDYDTDKDGVVDFFMMVFVGLGGNGDSQINGVPPYDNIWPHSSSLEFYFTDDETGLKGYISDDQLKSLSGVPQCWVSDAYQASDDCAADGGTGLDSLPVLVRVGPYNVNPEEAIDKASVISHEYGHSLGLPDFYSLGDRETYGDWNLMATDKGHNMDIFAKQELGWIVPQVLQPGDQLTDEDWTDSKVDTGEIHWVDPNGDPYTLSAANGDQKVHNADAWMVKLPTRKVIDEAVVANGASLDHVWWSGSGNNFGCSPLGARNLDIYLPELAALDPGDSVELRFKTNFDIEWDYDYGFVLYSTDFGANYTSMSSGSGYTDPASQNPNANGCQAQYGNGISGTTSSRDAGPVAVTTDRGLGNYPANTGFSADSYDLSAAAGSETVVRFSYATDPGLARPGWFIDDIEVVVNGTDVIYSSDFEGGANEDRIFNGGCQGERGRVAQTCTSGWKYINASAGSPADHAYYLEMRDRSGFDVDGKGENSRAAIAFQPGVLLTYTDENHGYGNVGTDDQPAQTPVDSRPVPGDIAPNLNDAAFKTGDTYSDASPGWTDNYESTDGPTWVHDFDCLNFTVDSLSGTDIALPYNLIGDVTFDLGDGCRTFDYGNDDVIPNVKPTAVAQARPTETTTSEAVTFDGSLSYDQETASQDLGYSWDFGDGSAPVTGAVVMHTYTTPGTYTATLTVTDEALATDTDTIDIVVTGNNRPEANNDDVTTDENVGVDIDVLVDNGHGPDTDPDGDTLTIESFTQPANGTVTAVDDDTLHYEPDPGFFGTDTFNYTITDGSLNDSALVTVSVIDQNSMPNAVDDSYSVFEDQTLEVAAPGVLANDSDGDGDDLTVSVLVPPSKGTLSLNSDGSFTYEPNPDFNGEDQFAYEVNDGAGEANSTSSATVTITVNPVNDAPVAVDDAAATDNDTAVTVDVVANDLDPDGDTVTVDSVDQPANGTVVVNGDGTVTYTPDLGFEGEDSFTYVATDGHGGFDDATVTITVGEGGGDECRNDLCANDDEPDVLTMTFVGGTCADSNNSQDDKSECEDHTSGASGTVFIKATNKEDADYDNAKVYFEGVVSEGESFDISAAYAGEDDLYSKTFLHIYSADGTTLLQTVEIHTSCSAPLVEGDQFGSVVLGDEAAASSSDAPICTGGEGRVHGSGHWDRGTDEQHDKVDFSFDAKDYKGGLKGKLKIHDKDLDVKIDSKTITSLSTGTGVLCGGLLLDGATSFAFTAIGDFEVGDVEQENVEFFACGVDNGKKGKGDDNQDPDYLYVEVTDGPTYNTGDRADDNYIDGGNIHLHDPITDSNTSTSASAPATSGGSSAQGSQANTNSDLIEGLGEVQVVDLDPLLLNSMPAGAPMVLTAVVSTDGLLALVGHEVVLKWETADGATGEATALTNLVGVATFAVTMPSGDVTYTAWSGDLDSNGVRITGN